MNKPDWKDAPGWANYLAMDCDGEWYWFEEKPFKHDDIGLWDFRDGEVKEAHLPCGNEILPSKSWADSLETRPQ